MTPYIPQIRRTVGALILLWLITVFMPITPVAAAPGAHGPNGEHLAGLATKVGTSRLPRMETFSDTFEIVATLTGSELSILIDRYATNEPVLGATVEVESGTFKAKAKFHADHGDYAIDEAAFLKALAAPGAHPLVFTVVAGEDSDLLNGTLNVESAAADAHHHEFLGLHERTWFIIGGAILIAGIAAFFLRRRRPAVQAWEGRA
jgi:LPXTG-motif cell wall-anchored protein